MNRSARQSVLGGLLGNALEWYDFILYAYYAPIFATLFFPKVDEYISLLATFGIFASGFLARPLGGFLLGICSDTFGRRKALIISIILMTSATFLIALLPTYSTIGFWAPLLLTLLRIMQGIAVGGELTSSTTFLVEHASETRRGLLGSLILSSAFFGMLIGSGLSFLTSAIFSPFIVVNWGWRIVYLIGALFGYLAYYLRIKSCETPHYLRKKALNSPKSTKSPLFLFRKELALSFIFTSILAVGNYILIAYMTMFLTNYNHFSFEKAMMINFISLFLLSALIPIFGYLSDKIGRKNVLMLGALSILIAAIPIFLLLIDGRFLSALISELFLAICLAPINAIVPVLLIELFPTSFRTTGSSIAYNTSQALFGGTAPLISLLLIKITGNYLAPGIYLFIFALSALIAISFLHETSNKSLLEVIEID